ncbi:MAG: 2-phospho-L-lactate transferase CofD family protein [Patescibacteria group bacterium]
MKKAGSLLKVVMFSGGRGTGALTEALLRYPDIELTLLVNAYDDGLSTGLLRRFIPGMLGPSDIRKNVSRFIQQRNDPASQALLFLIEYRFPEATEVESALTTMRDFIHFSGTGEKNEVLEAREKLSLQQVRIASRYLEAFLQYYEKHIPHFQEFPFADCSLGNLLFAGCYLVNEQDFNRTIADFSQFTEIGDRVLNVTQGENRVLVAMKHDGQYLHDEASIVGPQDASRIDEIFLLPQYLNSATEAMGQYKIDNIRFLRNKEMLPTISSSADQALREADIIIYGPGTQYSSLFPSYLTSGVAEAIQANTQAEKVFIGNIARDYDILGEDATTLVRAFLWNMSRKVGGSVDCHNLVTRFFFQKPETNTAGETPYVPFNAEEFEYPLEKVTWIDLEGEKGKHSGSRTVSELLLIVENQLHKRVKHVSQKVSIIVPALNEERTIKQVLRELTHLQFPGMGLEKEIIVVDGGSRDKTYEIASKESFVRVYKNEGHRGRGMALRLGIEKAKGDIIVFFPSDSEYTVSDIVRVVSPLVNQEFPAVFGSRAFRRTHDLNGTLKRVYGNKNFLFLVSKYGGMLLSVMTLLLYQRFISDPLTSLKGFNARIFRTMNFSSYGVDFDMELIAKIAREEHVILEIPVSYTARTVQEGKKITLKDGIACLIALMRFSTWKPKNKLVETKYAKGVNRYSGV